MNQLSQWRVTLLPEALLAARNYVFLVAGKHKAQPVKQVFHSEYDPQRYPAQSIACRAHRVVWFLDEAAAAVLDEEGSGR